eukprot:3504851-Alexandrium_andersonii.AAC.1
MPAEACPSCWHNPGVVCHRASKLWAHRARKCGRPGKPEEQSSGTGVYPSSERKCKARYTASSPCDPGGNLGCR